MIKSNSNTYGVIDRNLDARFTPDIIEYLCSAAILAGFMPEVPHVSPSTVSELSGNKGKVFRAIRMPSLPCKEVWRPLNPM